MEVFIIEKIIEKWKNAIEQLILAKVSKLIDLLVGWVWRTADLESHKSNIR